MPVEGKNMEFDCIEMERRLAIGFNEHLSLESRHSLVTGGQTLEDISRIDDRFRPYLRETRDVIHWLSRSLDRSIIWYGDADYPSFSPIKTHLPYMILCEGERPTLMQKCAGIIGTRHATYGGIQQAFRFGLEATENGMSVISGFAEGIDQSAMRGALEGNGPCMGVLACGHEVEYPCLTLELRKRMIDSGGCILSRFAPEAVAFKSNFLSRNLIIAAYSSFLVAVQAPYKSGTLNTCDYASQMEKEIFVGSEGVGDRFVQAGTTDLFNAGATVLTSLACRDVSDGEQGFKVVECPDSFLSDSEGSAKRFGDRCYLVQKEVGSA